MSQLKLNLIFQQTIQPV